MSCFGCFGGGAEHRAVANGNGFMLGNLTGSVSHLSFIQLC